MESGKKQRMAEMGWQEWGWRAESRLQKPKLNILMCFILLIRFLKLFIIALFRLLHILRSSGGRKKTHTTAKSEPAVSGRNECNMKTEIDRYVAVISPVWNCFFPTSLAWWKDDRMPHWKSIFTASIAAQSRRGGMHYAVAIKLHFSRTSSVCSSSVKISQLLFGGIPVHGWGGEKVHSYNTQSLDDNAKWLHFQRRQRFLCWE